MPDFTLVQWLAIWFLVSVAATPFIGSLLHKLRTRREFQGHLAREARRVRLEQKLELVDDLEAAQTSEERRRVFIKATELGFTVPDETEYHAFMDEGEGPRAA